MRIMLYDMDKYMYIQAWLKPTQNKLCNWNNQCSKGLSVVSLLNDNTSLEIIKQLHFNMVW